MKFLIALLMCPTPPAATTGVQEMTLGNLRFLDERGDLTLISPDAPLPGGQPGLIKAEVTFQSDRIDQGGHYVGAPLAVLWRFETAAGDVLLTASGGAWHGNENPDPVSFLSVEPWTGRSTAALELPIGRLDQAPLLPVGTGTLEVVLGWRDRVHFGSTGQPVDTVAGARLTLGVDLPEIWLGSLDPDATHDVGAVAEYALVLREPTSVLRRFTLESHPPGRVALVRSVVSLQPGEREAVVEVRGEEPGSYSLSLREDGRPVTETATGRVETPLGLYALAATPQGPFGQESVVGQLEVLLLKKCKQAFVYTGAQTEVTICGPCSVNGAEHTCQGAGGGKVGFAIPGKCVTGWGECTLFTETVQAGVYKHLSDYVIECHGGMGLGISTRWGGGEVTILQKKHKKCCTYEYADAQGNIAITNCY